ncbi:hypothetical protein HPB47_024893 [Ixodes persulcatus]|uniref:Uncharacterized protein n=1 Tax=Ixodes persulcatus TaxID=34615 RepID=A0AC60Q2Y8_IXOPE|nr:hypothetical protein HPB47_024893 [Ixodes persulcatus]
MITHAYVRYVDDNTHAIVPISSIKDFHPSGPSDFSDGTKYYVRWHGDGGDSEFYRARILLLGVSEEDVTVKLKNGRLRVRKVIESSDYSEEDSLTTEKENVKAQKVDIGKGVLVDQASLLLAQGKRDALFVKDLAVAVYGSRLLMDSSVLDVYVARLVSNGMPERFAKAATKDVTRFINEKITELRRHDSRRKAAQEKFDLEGAVEPEGNA